MSETRRRLDELKKAIYAADRELLSKLEERARSSIEIRALLKDEAPSIDVDERAWMEDLLARSDGEWPEASLRRIFSTIRAEARALERPARVAYAGPEGSFAALAAEAQFGTGGEYIEAPTVAAALGEVSRQRADYAVFAFESSVDGLVQSAIAALTESELVVVAETIDPARYSVLSGTGNAADVEKLYSTGNAQAACESALAREFPRASVIDVRSPKMACELAVEDHSSAAVVPTATGERMALRSVKENVGEFPELSYRYAVAASRPAARSGNDTTCLVFSVGDTPGALFAVLRHFAERDVNLKRMQSRPAKSQGWDYLFYAEVTGHASDRGLVTALEAIKRDTPFLKVLGSFPAAE
jgi:chorismate mutase / prephenate dehydratase